MTREYRVSREGLKALQDLDLGLKIQKTVTRIIEWFNRFDGKIYCSFSGGKDSTVLLHIIRSLDEPYCNIPVVFCDTHNERKEIYDFVATVPNVTTIDPKCHSVKQIISEYGYPCFSKEISRTVYYAQKGTASGLRKINGLDKNGNPSEFRKRFIKYLPFVDCGVKISHKCCDILKKEPFIRYEKETGRVMITAEMADESDQRLKAYLHTGCNAFDLPRPKSKPMGFWRECDVLDYIAYHRLQIAACYGAEITDDADGKRHCELKGVARTGCQFCGFGKGYDRNVEIIRRLGGKVPSKEASDG